MKRLFAILLLSGAPLSAFAESYVGALTVERCVSQDSSFNDVRCTPEKVPALGDSCTISFGEGRYQGLVHLREGLSGTLGTRGWGHGDHAFINFEIKGLGGATQALVRYALDEQGRQGAPQLVEIKETMTFLGNAVTYVSRCANLQAN